eukprot:m.86797 g.86797  ORF g.86797 m.86797 type:complete len:281 (+) comp26004_c0_seq1:190-1032(+)
MFAHARRVVGFSVPLFAAVGAYGHFSTTEKRNRDHTFATALAQGSAKDLEVAMKEIREQEEAMRLRWIRDEDHWRKLPARAWPAYQPGAEQLDLLRAAVEKACPTAQSGKEEECMTQRFLLATCLLYNKLDEVKGLEMYQANANNGHLDSATAAGICLFEGYHGTIDEKEGVKYMLKAYAGENTQAIFEVACLHYTGAAEPHLPEDMSKAYMLLEVGAAKDHTCSQYLLADFLIDAPEGCCEPNFARAVKLLYQAGEKGHRTARQDLLAILDGTHPKVHL